MKKDLFSSINSKKIVFLILLVVPVFIMLLCSFASATTELSECSTIVNEGDYVLINDIAECNMRIGASNVNLDCQGHTLWAVDGTVIWMSKYVNGNLTDNNTIKNCKINLLSGGSGEVNGINVQFSKNSLILNNTIQGLPSWCTNPNRLCFGIQANYDSNNSRIINNTIKNANTGFFFEANNLTINGNIIENMLNSSIGYMGNSRDSHFYNNIFNSTHNIDKGGVSSNYKNYWNITKTAGTNILGKNFIAGNYWSDYNYTSSFDGDWIGDTAYILTENNVDYLPLVFNEAPAIPTINSPSPENNSITAQNFVALNCTSTDSDNDIVNIEFYVDSILKQNSTLTTYSFATNDGQTYAYRCRANDNKSNSAFTEIRTFTEQYTNPEISIPEITPLILFADSNINCSATATAENNLQYINFTFLVNNAYNSSVQIAVSGTEAFASTIHSPLPAIMNITCKVFAIDNNNVNSNEKQISKIVSTQIVILSKPLTNEQLTSDITILLKADINFIASSCSFYNKRPSATAYSLIATNSSLGTIHTYNYLIPNEIGFYDFKVTCDGVSDINTNIKVNSGNTGSSIPASIVDLLVGIGIALVSLVGVIALTFLGVKLYQNMKRR